MISRTYIIGTLESLDRLYTGSTSTKKGLFYSKLAILELCGWIEESMDDIVQRCAIRHLKKKSNRDVVDELVKRTYGFDYEKHFRNMLIGLIGIIHTEKLEKKVDPVKFQRLKSNLGSLKEYRDREAHTHLKGTTKRLDAPSVTKSKFLRVYEGLKNFDQELRRLRL